MTIFGSSDFLCHLILPILIWNVGSRVDIDFASFISIGLIFVVILTLSGSDYESSYFIDNSSPLNDPKISMRRFLHPLYAITDCLEHNHLTKHIYRKFKVSIMILTSVSNLNLRHFL